MSEYAFFSVPPQTSASRRAAFYIRVSTQEQAELSPDSQKRLLTEYAKNHGISVLSSHIFTENISGRRAEKRPQFQRMIALAKNHAFDMILVWKFSRFARNQEESIVYKNMLKKDGVEVVSISEPSVSGPFGSLIERIIEWMDEYYSIRLAGDVFRGMSEKARKGGYQSRPPIGYRISHPGALPEIVEEEAVIVRRIFSEYLKNSKSPLQIARCLNEEGKTTVSGHPFETRSVKYILGNPIYAGFICWNKTGGEHRLKNPREEWIIKEGVIPPLISKEAFRKAAVLLEQNKRSPSANHRKSTGSTKDHWLRGLVKCSSCGRSLSISSHRAKSGRIYRNLQCTGYLKGICPVSHQISEKKLLRLLCDTLDTRDPAALPPFLGSRLKQMILSESIPVSEKNAWLRSVFQEIIYDRESEKLLLRFFPFFQKDGPVGLERPR